MPLLPGTQVGVYEIVAALGAGGMGEVYRARDTKLGREVAIKIIPESTATDADRLARFQREARVLAALNHPNIATLYGVEEAPAITALVMELVEGDTLADRLLGRSGAAGERATRSLLPVSEVLSIARQMIEAMDAAHARGIVHRDLKPANVKVTNSGTVKVLDFGLAKSSDAMDAFFATELSRSPTFDVHGTGSGVLLGTIGYMSPEQARGLPVDKRADIWAFGCVVYEMLTGRPAFPGSTVSDVIVSVLDREPDWSLMPSGTPAGLARLVRRCLTKDPARRLRDIGDARFDLDETEPAASATHVPRREVDFQRLTEFRGFKESPALSPDGKMLAFVALVGGHRQIWIRLLSGGSALQVTRDPSDHEQPRWAPDSSTLIYYTRAKTQYVAGTIWEIGALGGQPRRVVTSQTAGDISPDGHFIVAIRRGDEAAAEMIAVSRDGSRTRTLARLPGDALYASPRWSHDGRSVGFIQSWGVDAFDQRLFVLGIDSGEPREVAKSEWVKGFAWLPDSTRLVYSCSIGSTLLYPPAFNLRVVSVDGRRDEQLSYGDTSLIDPDLRPPRKLVTTRIRSQSDIWRFPVDGSAVENTRAAERITHQTGQAQTPSVNPDGSEVVYLSDNGGHGNLWVAATDGSGTRQITFERDPAVVLGVPMWSPTGEWIVFILKRENRTGLWLIRPDGSDLRVFQSPGWSACWSVDGKWIYYTKPEETMSRARHEKAPIDGGPAIVVRENSGGAQGTVSRDGSTIYYAERWVSGDLGRWSGDSELISMRMEDGAVQSLAHIAASRVPVSPLLVQGILSPDQQRLVLPLVDGATTNVWEVPTRGGPMRQLTDFGNRSTLISRSLSWSPDGRYVYAGVAETETDIIMLDGLTD